jgi:hypothetical protein
MEAVRAEARATLIEEAGPEFKAALAAAQQTRADADAARLIMDEEIEKIRKEANARRLAKANGCVTRRSRRASSAGPARYSTVS